MGVVYSAVHERLGRPVAIKVLRRELSENTDLSSRFQMEAELVTRIGHPNIVAVYDFGRLPSGCLYYVMEMIRGQSLRSRLDQRPLSPQEIVQVFGPLLSAVRAAHEIGVVHRDGKPTPVPSRNENSTTWGKRREKRADDPASTVRSQSLHCSF